MIKVSIVSQPTVKIGVTSQPTLSVSIARGTSVEPTAEPEANVIAKFKQIFESVFGSETWEDD